MADDFNTTLQQANEAKAQGADPYTVDTMTAQLKKDYDIKNGANKFDAQKEYLESIAKYEVDYRNADPDAVNAELGKQLDDIASQKMVASHPVLGRMAAYGKGDVNLLQNTAYNAAILFANIRGAFGDENAKGTAAELRKQKAATNTAYEQDPYVQQYGNFAKAGEILTGAALPSGGVGPIVKGEGLIAYGAKTVANLAAQGAAYGALSDTGSDNLTSRLDNAGRGAIIGGAFGALPVGAAAVGKLAAKSINPDTLENIAQQQAMGLQPGINKAVGEADSNLSKALLNAPFVGKGSAKAAVKGAEEGLPQYVKNTLMPKPKMTANELNDFLAANNGKLPQSLSEVESQMVDSLTSNPLANVKNADQALEDLFQSKINSAQQLLKGQVTPEAAGVSSILQGVANKKNMTFAEAYRTKQDIGNQLSNLFSGGKKMSPTDRQIQSTIYQAVDSHTKALAKNAGLESQLSNLNTFSKQSADYRLMQTAVNKSANQEYNGMFDINLTRKNLNKIINNTEYKVGSDKLRLRTPEALNTAKGMAKVLGAYKNEMDVALGKGVGPISQTVSRGGTAIAGAAAAYASPTVAAGAAIGWAGARVLNTLMHNPQALRLLQDIGTHPNGMKMANELAAGIAKVGTIKSTDQKGNN